MSAISSLSPVAKVAADPLRMSLVGTMVFALGADQICRKTADEGARSYRSQILEILFQDWFAHLYVRKVLVADPNSAPPAFWNILHLSAVMGPLFNARGAGNASGSSPYSGRYELLRRGPSRLAGSLYPSHDWPARTHTHV